MKPKNKKYIFPLMAMAIIDALIFEASFLAVYFLRHHLKILPQIFTWPPFSHAQLFKGLHAFPAYLRLSLLFTGLLLILFYYFGLYRMKKGQDQLDEYFAVFKAVLLGVLILTGFTFLVQEIQYSRFVIFTSGPVAFLLLCLWRTMLWLLVGWLHKKGHGINHTLIYGAGQAGQMLVGQIREHGELGYKLVGFIDDDPAKSGQEIEGLKVLGAGKDIEKIVKEERIDEIILAFPSADRGKIYEIISEFENSKVNIKIMPDLYDIITSRVATDKIGNIPLLEMEEEPLKGWSGAVKRSVDITGSGLGLVVLSPLFLAATAVIKMTSPGPVFYKQIRLGKNEKPFTVYKFRTMKVGAEKEKDSLLAHNEAQGPIFKMKDDPRLTRIGKILRRTSIDELPQLINVFRGEMSLVGPRPPLPREVEKYNSWHKKRLAITPGITGLWQIRGRSLLPFEEMVKLDIYYQENWSLWLDFKILLKTIGVVLTGRGAY